MKKAFLFLGFVAVAAAVGGATAWAVSEHREQPVQYIERTVSHNSTPQAGNHFTSYQADQYPDLTYAAENAVKAVVNIESIQQIEMPRRRSYDPFLEFFGIPQELAKLALIKPFSGSGSLTLLTDVFSRYGADSYVSRCAATIYASSETVFYVFAVYFAGTDRRGRVLPLAVVIISSALGTVLACALCRVL